ncbi:2-phospho-L-lactate transferase [Carbonactinospora thermoautotrophica]|uniref:2-phospho-L-lactate transferase n=1 Tax=Carbonactinospora thermoautotrophica TaxID=1469144 RepID=A0A132N017_9ACTN|nr:2-phospho-L-lactate transferase [Carbonactinospora thermoautotrophica]KWX03505.1 2-phospho-L-lactate transferase [Carbonactinospora thermoautotrophica]KWX08793.1 2-phospho-L-lactate transferase [Carbonactinospora thermoautotrophica]MCX9190232.1 2-phospho-L-lactate transferase [Carbonactinospora thermoautotrophica]
MHIVVLAGGVGGARFIRGLKLAAPDAQITIVGNTADDITLFGLRVCPDLDTVMYTLGGGIHEEQGWGRADERFTVQEELAAYRAEPQWFTLGDRDFATHILRTQMLDAGYPLSQVTEALCARWWGGRADLRLLPMSDDRVETHVVIDDPETPGGRRAIHFQEWWVRRHAEPTARAIVPVGAEQAKPAPGVLEAIGAADVILLPPSNPVVSIGTILAVPGVRDAVIGADAPVVGLSPIVGSAPVRGMADKVLAAIGVETDAAAVALHYGRELLDGWLVDTVDADAVPVVEAAGIACRATKLTPLSDPAEAARMAREALELASTRRS